MDPVEIYIKEPKTYEQQLDILKRRNLIIDDTEEALTFLQKVNYYRFSAYGLTLKQKDDSGLFLDGVTFHQIKMIYLFDQKLREILMAHLELVEIEFRSRIAYYHTHKYGALGYKNSANFKSRLAHDKSLKKLDEQIERSRKELFVVHHKSKYNGEFPFWVAIEVISFGELSKLFRNLLVEDKAIIVEDYKISSYYIDSWLHTLTYIRNVCAHYGRLYGKKLTIEPKLFKSKKKLFKNDDVFAAIFILCKLLDKDNHLNFITSLQALSEEYSEYINHRELGFPKQWEDLLKR